MPRLPENVILQHLLSPSARQITAWMRRAEGNSLEVYSFPLLRAKRRQEEKETAASLLEKKGVKGYPPILEPYNRR